MKTKFWKPDPFLLLILLLAAAVRLWGISFGLPNVFCRPDESTIVITALGFGKMDFNPHFFNYPSLLMYVSFASYGVYYLSGLLSGRFAAIDDLVREYTGNPANFYLINRLLSATLGTLSVWIVYQICLNLFGKRTARIAALFMAFAYLHVRESHFGVTDVPMTFMVLCAVFFILRIYRDKTFWSYVFAGLFSGLAMSTKYNGLFLIGSILVAHVCSAWDKKEYGRIIADKNIWICVLVFICAFLAGTPFALLDSHSFISDFMYEMQHLRHGHGVDLGPGWLYHIRFSLYYGLGWSLWAAGLSGVVLLLWKQGKEVWILLSFPLLYYVISGQGLTVFVRYAVPLVPFLCMTAAFIVVHISERITTRWPKAENYAVVFLSLIILPSFVHCLRFDYFLTQRDSRLLAADWIRENLPEDSSIYQTGMFFGWAQLFPQRRELQLRKRAMENAAVGGKQRIHSMDHLIYYMDHNHLPGYAEWDYDTLACKFTYNHTLMGGEPDFIVVVDSPIDIYDKQPPIVAELLRTDYQLIQLIIVSDRKACNDYDQLDAFYLPFAGFDKIIRPGPNFAIYRKHGVP